MSKKVVSSGSILILSFNEDALDTLEGVLEQEFIGGTIEEISESFRDEECFQDEDKGYVYKVSFEKVATLKRKFKVEIVKSSN